MFLLFLATRLAIGAWALMEPDVRMVNGDSGLYMELGRQLLEEGRYEGYARPPGYPALIAVVYAVFGTGWWGYAGLLLLNLAGGIALWFGLMRLTGGKSSGGHVGPLTGGHMGPLTGGHVGPLTGGHVGPLTGGHMGPLTGGHMGPLTGGHMGPPLMIDLAWLLFSKEVLTEALFTPLIVWMVVGLTRGSAHDVGRSGGDAGKSSGGHMGPLTGGHVGPLTGGHVGPLTGGHVGPPLMLGLATLLKPITFYLPWVLVPYLLWRKWPLGRVAVFVLISAGIPFIWQARNAAVHGTFAYTSIASENLMTGHAAFTLSAAEGLSHSEAIDSVRTLFWAGVADPAALQADEDAFNARKAAVARRILADHPVTYVLQIAKGVVFTLFDPGREVWERTFGAGPPAVGITETVARDGIIAAAWRILSDYPFLVLYVLFLAGIYGWALWRLPSAWKADPALTALLLLLIAYFLVLGGPIGYARFRMYIFPLILTLPTPAFGRQA